MPIMMNIEKRRKRVIQYVRRKRQKRNRSWSLLGLAFSVLIFLVFLLSPLLGIRMEYAGLVRKTLPPPSISFYPMSVQASTTSAKSRQTDVIIVEPARVKAAFPILKTASSSSSTYQLPRLWHKEAYTDHVQFPMIPEKPILASPQSDIHITLSPALNAASFVLAKREEGRSEPFPLADSLSGKVVFSVTLAEDGSPHDVMLISSTESAMPLYQTVLRSRGTRAAQGILTYEWFRPKVVEVIAEDQAATPTAIPIAIPTATITHTDKPSEKDVSHDLDDK